MPRFNFQIFNDTVRLETISADLPCVKAARMEALVFTGEMIRSAGMGADMGDNWHMNVTDQTGLTLFRLDFAINSSAAVPALSLA